MASLNKWMGIGNLTRDPEVKYTPKGTAVCEADIAINRRYTTEGGEKREEVTFVNVTFFGKTAELVGEYCHKGDPLFISGRLTLDTWDDKATGQKRSKMKVTGEEAQFLKGKSESDRSHEDRPSRRSDPPAGRPKSAPDPDLDIEPDDCPF